MKKFKKLFAAILLLCMIATMFVAVPVSAATENVIDINLALDDVSELTWKTNAVTLSNADGIGGRDKVIKAEGLANSNNNTVGVKLPDGFAFCEGDVLTYSLDVYSETAINPDLWLRNHGNSLNPMAVFYSQPMATGEWITLTKTVTYDELEAIIPTVNSNGTFATAGNYAFYLRPRSDATVYLDNLQLAVEREVIERGNVVEIEVNEASDITYTNGGVAADANGIGGRDGVVELSNLANSNGSTAGVKLPDGFAFQEDDILTYSFDIYTSITNPDIWLRNHGSSLTPFVTFYQENVVANTWTTISKSFTYDQIVTATGVNIGSGWNVADNYALYFRPRQNGTIYIDNFKVTVARVGYEAPEEVVRKNVVDVDVKSASDITWTGSDAVVVSDANGIGGRDNVVKAEGVANSNNNTVGVKLGDSFAFCEGDILTFSVDVYSETAMNPDLWLRNHTNLPTFVTFYEQPMAANTWTKITKTVTYADLVATGVEGWDSEGTYAFYLRPRQNVTAYLDNFKVTVSRIDNGEPEVPPVDPDVPEDNRENVVDINLALDAANELTWVASEAVTVTAVDGIGGRDKVLMAEGLANSNNNTVGVKLPDGFAFDESDILTYSVDVYSETAINPDMWLRNHGTALTPFITFYNEPIAANTWTTITKTVTYADLAAAGDGWTNADNYAFYLRPRSDATVYLDNLKLTITREKSEPDEPEEIYIPGDVDGNGEVVVRDVIFLRRYIAGGYDIVVNDAALDIDRDGEVVVRDVITLRRFIAGGYDIELK